MISTHNVTRQTRRYWMIDGLPELAIGVFTLLLAGIQALTKVAPPVIAGFATLGVALITVVFCVFVRWALHAVKARLTYPRTGYVEYQQPPRWQQTLGAVVGVILGAGLARLLFNTQLSAVWLPVITGLGLGLAMVWLGFYVGMARFYALALVLSMAGVGFWLAGINGFVGESLVMLIMGVWLLVSGGLTLSRYVQINRERQL